MAKEGTEGALPGLGLTEEQLFFVGFARVGIYHYIAGFYVYVLSLLKERIMCFHTEDNFYQKNGTI